MTVKEMYKPQGYRMALRMVELQEEGTEAMEIARKILDNVIKGMLEDGSTWMAYELIGDVENMIEASDDHPDPELDQKIDDTISLLDIYGFGEDLRNTVELPDRWNED